MDMSDAVQDAENSSTRAINRPLRDRKRPDKEYSPYDKPFDRTASYRSLNSVSHGGNPDRSLKKTESNNLVMHEDGKENGEKGRNNHPNHEHSAEQEAYRDALNLTLSALADGIRTMTKTEIESCPDIMRLLAYAREMEKEENGAIRQEVQEYADEQEMVGEKIIHERDEIFEEDTISGGQDAAEKAE